MADPAAAQAYRVLEGMIVTQELAPGAATTEALLIAATGLGRTPVREAIQRLAWEGFIEVRPRAGLFVAPLHPGDWVKVIDVRRGVEPVLARGAARFATATQAEAFRAASRAMDDAVAAGDVKAFLRADKTLDEALARGAGNAFAARLAGPLQTHSRRFWFCFQADTGLSEAAARHVELIEAILSRNEEKAAAAADRLMTLLRRHAEAAALTRLA